MNGTVKFLPWVGANYTNGINGKRIMALGESHYCNHPSEAVPEITNSVILDLLNPSSDHEGYKNTYTKFERALALKTLSQAEKAELWNSIAFYNYVQVPMTGARVSPTKDDFVNSTEALFKVLNQHLPNILIVWGQRLYKNLPESGHQGQDLILPDGKISETWIYPLSNGHNVYILPINHPSSGFSWEYWGEGIKEMLNKLSTVSIGLSE